MILTFLAFIVLTNFIDKKFFEGKYAIFINTFAGIFSCIFFFVGDDFYTRYLTTNFLDKCFVITYLVLRSSFNLIQLSQSKEPKNIQLIDLISMALLSLNYLPLKAVIFLGLVIPNVFLKGKVLKLHDLFALLAFLSLAFSDDIASIIFPFLVIIYILEFLNGAFTRASLYKLIMLISICDIMNKANSLTLYTLFFIVFVFSFCVFMPKDWKEKLTAILKESSQIQKIIINYKFKVKNEVSLNFSATSDKIAQKISRNYSIKDIDYENQLVTTAVLIIILSVILGTGATYVY